MIVESMRLLDETSEGTEELLDLLPEIRSIDLTCRNDSGDPASSRQDIWTAG